MHMYMKVEPIKDLYFVVCFQKLAQEDSKIDPWTMLAKHKMEVERQLRNLTDLNYLVLRPATVYGLGDKNGLGEMSQDKVTCILA